jgi:hypothetical protein
VKGIARQFVNEWQSGQVQMTADQLRAFKHKLPFKPFTIHLSDGTKLEVGDPESLVLPKDWTTDAIITFPRGRFSFVYIKNITHVSGVGGFPNLKPRRRGKDSGGNE